MKDLTRFVNQIENVVKWNAVARNGEHDFSEDAIKRQGDYVSSEIRETLVGCMNYDLKETLDGIADIFVTLVYKHYLQTGGQLINSLDPVLLETVQYHESTKAFELELYKNQEYSLINNCVFDLLLDNDNAEKLPEIKIEDLLDTMCLVEAILGVDIMDVVEHVMESNWSKFPKVEDTNINYEVRTITEKMAPKGFKDIVGVVNEEHGVVVFRTDNGVGKIMKPSSFWEPDCGKFAAA